MEKIRITVEHTGRNFDVMFNPEEYTLNKDNNFSSKNLPGKSSPLLQFVHGNSAHSRNGIVFRHIRTGHGCP